MAVTKMATTQELGTITEQTSFHDSGSEIHTVTVRMGETSIYIKMHKRYNGKLTKPNISIFKLKGECSIFTEHDEKVSKQTTIHTSDDGEKFKTVDLEVQ
tara:strand:- start:672 stop:971 length:300 start_codon:yes stop_codon:yes gene_type:complete